MCGEAGLEPLQPPGDQVHQGDGGSILARLILPQGYNKSLDLDEIVGVEHAQDDWKHGVMRF